MSDTTWMRCYNDKNIVTGGTVQMGAFTVTSDRRLKTDIIELVGSGSIIDRLKVYEFTKHAPTWEPGDRDRGVRMYGVLAQEVREILPVVVKEGSELHPIDGDPILTVDLTQFVPLLIDEVKALRVRVATLEARP